MQFSRSVHKISPGKKKGRVSWFVDWTTSHTFVLRSLQPGYDKLIFVPKSCSSNQPFWLLEIFTCWNLNPLMKVYFWIFQIAEKAKQLQAFLWPLLARGSPEGLKVNDEKWHKTWEDKTPQGFPSLLMVGQPRSWKRLTICVHKSSAKPNLS